MFLFKKLYFEFEKLNLRAIAISTS